MTVKKEKSFFLLVRREKRTGRRLVASVRRVTGHCSNCYCIASVLLRLHLFRANAPARSNLRRNCAPPPSSLPREHRSFFYFLPVKEAASIMLVYLPRYEHRTQREKSKAGRRGAIDARALLAPFSHRPVCSYVPQYRSTRRARPTHVQRGRERKESTCGGRSVRRPPMDCNGCGIERMAHTGESKKKCYLRIQVKEISPVHSLFGVPSRGRRMQVLMGHICFFVQPMPSHGGGSGGRVTRRLGKAKACRPHFLSFPLPPPPRYRDRSAHARRTPPSVLPPSLHFPTQSPSSPRISRLLPSFPPPPTSRILFHSTSFFGMRPHQRELRLGKRGGKTCESRRFGLSPSFFALFSLLPPLGVEGGDAAARVNSFLNLCLSSSSSPRVISARRRPQF